MRPSLITATVAVAMVSLLAPVPAHAQTTAELNALLQRMQQDVAALEAKADSMAKLAQQGASAPTTPVNGTPLTAEQTQELAGAMELVQSGMAEALAAAGIQLSIPGAPKAAAPAGASSRGGCGAVTPDPKRAAEVDARLQKLKATPGADPNLIRQLSRAKGVLTQGRRAARNCRMG